MKKILSFIFALSLGAAAIAQPQGGQPQGGQPQGGQQQGGFAATLQYPEVYRDDNVVFYQVDDKLWIGNGHVMASETLYIVAGDESAVLIDTGTSIPGLDKITENILGDKPYQVILTHVHPDHAGSCNNFSEVWIAQADEFSMPQFAPGFTGKTLYLEEGQKFDLGGRTLEVLFTPGHTPGCVTFVDKANHYAFSGDSFGNGNLLLGTDFSTMADTCKKALKYMQKNDIYYCYNGHFFGTNYETTRQIYVLQTLCEDVLSGKAQGTEVPGNFGGSLRITVPGLNINYGPEQIK